MIKGVSSCSSLPGLAPSGIERPEWVAVPAPYVTVRWPVVDDVCARQSIRSTCFQIRGAANVRHAFEVRLSSQRSSRDRRAKMAATNSLGRSRRGDDMVGYVQKSRCPRLARDRSAFISTGLWYLASVSNTWCRCVDDVARSKAAASNGQQQPSRRTRSSDYRPRLRCPVCQLHLSQMHMHAS